MSTLAGSAGISGPSKAELDELRASVTALREQLDKRFGSRKGIRKRGAGSEGVFDVLGRGLRRLEGLSLIELYDDLRRHVSPAERASVPDSIDEFGLDREYLERARGPLDFLYDRWWRVHTVGVENIPDDAPVLFVANRSGVLPYDGLMIAHACEREHPTRLRPRFLVADWLVTLPFSQPLLARIGGVRACQENAERLLASGQWVVAFPEGQKGALKPFNERYRLQRFGRGGFVSLAVRRRAVIVPTAVVGGEEIHPILYLPQLAHRILGAPLTVTPTFPLLGPLGLVPLPSRWRIRFGDPIRFDDVAAERSDDPLYVNRKREQVRGAIQSLLDTEVRERTSVWR
jgi:1-acyl-sn-glycerol-3-phosphate acyltransferase